jgi:hypothetical protein
VVSLAALASCAPSPPAEDVLRVEARVVGADGVVDVDFADTNSRGEWWPCDARLSATGCVDDRFHVSVFLGLPSYRSFDEVGGSACVQDGQASGVFEIIQRHAALGDNAVVGEDLSAFVLVASDADGNGVASLEDPRETLGLTRLQSGVVEVGFFDSFDTPFSIRLAGESPEGPVVIEFRATMTSPPVVPALEPSSTCVVGEAG